MIDWTCSRIEETGCTHRVFVWETSLRNSQFEGREKTHVFGINFFSKICYEDRRCMEQDEKCVLLGTLSEDLKLRVPKLSLCE